MSIEWQRDEYGNLYADIGRFRIMLEPALGTNGNADTLRADVMINTGKAYSGSFKLGTYPDEREAQRDSPRELAALLSETIPLLIPTQPIRLRTASRVRMFGDMTNADREELVRLRKEAELRACDIDAIDHYREGLYRILRGEENPREIAADYLGESL